MILGNDVLQVRVGLLKNCIAFGSIEHGQGYFPFFFVHKKMLCQNAGKAFDFRKTVIKLRDLVIVRNKNSAICQALNVNRILLLGNQRRVSTSKVARREESFIVFTSFTVSIKCAHYTFCNKDKFG